MNKKILTLALLSLSLVACEQQGTVKKSSTSTTTQTVQDNDNTGKNVRDRDSANKTPFDQSESDADRTITQKIRQSLVSDDTLSTNAKNVKIITINGVVTLRGPVASASEKDVIGKKAASVSGISRIDNQLEVTK